MHIIGVGERLLVAEHPHDRVSRSLLRHRLYDRRGGGIIIAGRRKRGGSIRPDGIRNIYTLLYLIIRITEL